MIQTSKDKMWHDESGQRIPYSRITKSERLMERQSAKLMKGAQGLNKKLSGFKNDISKICQEAYDVFMTEKELVLIIEKGILLGIILIEP